MGWFLGARDQKATKEKGSDWNVRGAKLGEFWTRLHSTGLWAAATMYPFALTILLGTAHGVYERYVSLATFLIL